MRIIDIKRISGCLEGTNVREVIFDGVISERFARGLMKLGKSIYRPETEKPFFKVMVRGKYTLKGSVGNTTARLLLPKDDDEEIIQELTNAVEMISREVL